MAALILSDGIIQARSSKAEKGPRAALWAGPLLVVLVLPDITFGKTNARA